MESLQGVLNWLDRKEINIEVRIRAVDKDTILSMRGGSDFDNEGRQNAAHCKSINNN